MKAREHVATQTRPATELVHAIDPLSTVVAQAEEEQPVCAPLVGRSPAQTGHDNKSPRRGVSIRYALSRATADSLATRLRRIQRNAKRNVRAEDEKVVARVPDATAPVKQPRAAPGDPQSAEPAKQTGKEKSVLLIRHRRTADEVQKAKAGRQDSPPRVESPSVLRFRGSTTTDRPQSATGRKPSNPSPERGSRLVPVRIRLAKHEMAPDRHAPLGQATLAKGEALGE
jgi:hypothetical protein